MAIAPGPGPAKSKIQNPNSKRPVWISDFWFWILDFGFWILDFGFWILDFGFRILDFGFWILDFGFWILDFGFWISLVFVLFVAAPKRPRLDFGFWISDFGFWILDFGLGLGLLRTVWILHKIFPSHADSGRRITLQFWTSKSCIRITHYAKPFLWTTAFCSLSKWREAKINFSILVKSGPTKLSESISGPVNE